MVKEWEVKTTLCARSVNWNGSYLLFNCHRYASILPDVFCSPFPPPLPPHFHGHSHQRFVFLAVQVWLSYHAEGQTNTIQQHVDCTWMSSHNTLLCFSFPSNLPPFFLPLHPLALAFVFVPGPSEGVFQNRRYWHWNPNQIQASLANCNHDGRGGGREKGRGAWLRY